MGSPEWVPVRALTVSAQFWATPAEALALHERLAGATRRNGVFGCGLIPVGFHGVTPLAKPWEVRWTCNGFDHARWVLYRVRRAQSGPGRARPVMDVALLR